MRQSGKYIYPLILFVLIILAWHGVSSSHSLDHWILPSPLKVLSAFFEAGDLLWYHFKFTLQATVYGLTISIVLGLATAVLMDSIKVFQKALYPYLIASQTIPIIAVAPLLIIWFGYGLASKVFTVVLICFFPIAFNFWIGLGSVSIDQIRLIRSMGAGRWQTFRYLKLPASLPSLFTGLKLSATYSVMGAIIGEWLGGVGGLGIYMTRAGKSYLTHHVYAIVIVIVMLSLALFLIVSLFERILVKWNTPKQEEYKDFKELSN
ncbi:MAG: ABC transporter permease [Candidatus Cloacimonadota bacterium]